MTPDERLREAKKMKKRKRVDILRRMCDWMSDCGNSKILREDAKPLIKLLEGRIGTSDAESRIKELEGALRPFIEPDVGLIGEPETVGSVVTLEQFARAARALKGEG